MDNIDKVLRDIRPKLRVVAPLTYFISWGFAIFNVAISVPLYRINEESFLIVGVVSTKIWAAAFFVMGFLIMYALLKNKWKLDQNLMLLGVFLKSAWLMELIARTVNGKSFILVAIWSLLLYLQFVAYLYFTPVERNNVR